MASWFSFFLLLVAVVGTAFAVQCYMGANGDYQKYQCPSTFNALYQCSKTITNTGTYKSCSTNCQNGITQLGYFTYCCDSDLCNAVGGRMALVSVVLALLSLFVMF